MNHPRTILITALALISSFVFAGCSQSMAITPDTKTLDLSAKSVALFTLTVKNDVKPDYGAVPNDILTKSDESGSTHFLLDGGWDGEGKPPIGIWTGFTECPVRLGLAPGKYNIDMIKGLGSTLILLWHFDFPLNADFNLPPGSVVYIGHVEMTSRQRKDGEPRSGDVTPLIDQGISGWANGTMDISITDESATDIPKFQAKYPCLQGITIQKAIMIRPQ